MNGWASIRSARPYSLASPRVNVEHVSPSTVEQAVPIEVAGPEAGTEHRFDLRPELGFQFLDLCPCQQFGHPVEGEQVAVFGKQRRHALPRGERTPAVVRDISNDREVDAEGEIRVLLEEAHRLGSTNRGRSGLWTGRSPPQTRGPPPY